MLNKNNWQILEKFRIFTFTKGFYDIWLKVIKFKNFDCNLIYNNTDYLVTIIGILN